MENCQVYGSKLIPLNMSPLPRKKIEDSLYNHVSYNQVKLNETFSHKKKEKNLVPHELSQQPQIRAIKQLYFYHPFCWKVVVHDKPSPKQVLRTYQPAGSQLTIALAHLMRWNMYINFSNGVISSPPTLLRVERYVYSLSRSPLALSNDARQL